MKVIRFLAAAAIVLTATTAMAQGGPPGGGQGRPNQMARLMEGITLTAEQQAKVDSISASSRAESMKLREEMQAAGGPPSDELRAKMMAISTKRNDAIKAVLTAEQKAIFEKNLASMPPMGGGQRPPR
ncbi:MAG TPA: Spy/CpxP family protein refolding chaperone [Gemmatimonadaceae bacterium]|jgi:Spy/CpxP family protein refolding chaperone